MIDITRNKHKFWRQIVRTWLVFERGFAEDILPIMMRQWRDAAQIVEAGSQNIDQAVADHRKSLTTQFETNYRLIGASYNDMTQEALDKALRDVEDEFWRVFNTWMAVEAASQVGLVNATTTDVIELVIAKGIAEGLDYRGIAQKIREVSPTSNAFRAARIARTEVHTVYGKSVDETVRANDARIADKEWLSALDERTREPHLEANGQRVPMNEKFIVDGEGLEYPGDPSGSAANIIQCRCVCLYNTVRR